jgi:class 3 adenylate cyclase
VPKPTKSFELSLAISPAKLWPLVTDTARLNAATGLPPVNYRDEPQEGGLSRRFFSFEHMGIEFAGEEYPSSWEANRFFEIHRIYSTGPFVELRFRVELEASDPSAPESGCLCRYLYWIEPRDKLGEQFLGGMDEGMLAPIQKLLVQAAEQIGTDGGTTTWLDLAACCHQPSPAQEESVERLCADCCKLHDCPEMHLLAEHILHAPDLELQRIRPLQFARDRGLNPDDTLATLLAATRGGLLKMAWQLVCPHCKGGQTGEEDLSKVPEVGYCQACDIDFEVDLGEALEVVFHPHPQVREIEHSPYCLAGPASSPHFLHQRFLRPGETWETTLVLDPGVYRIRGEGVEGDHMLELVSSSSTLESLPALGSPQRGLDLELAGGFLPEQRFAFATGAEIPISIRNNSARATVLRIEDLHWPSDALVAADVVNLQQFRDLFTGQLLAPGVSLGVESVTILFTDLVGSTAMYEALGDSDAFSLVWNHFDIIKEILAKHRGALVKTIGDAVMASFSRPEDALLASCEIQDTVTRAMAESGHRYPVALKMGIHSGAAITITANGRLDYFGSAVNLAARTESMSKGADIVITPALALATDGARVLEERGWRSQRVSTNLKGFAQPVQLLRFTRTAPAD